MGRDPFNAGNGSWMGFFRVTLEDDYIVGGEVTGLELRVTSLGTWLTKARAA